MSAAHYPDDAWFDIETLVNVAQPSSIALLGDFDAGFLDEFIAQTRLIGRPCQLQAFNRDSLDQFTNRVDVVIVADLIEHLDKTAATVLLGKLRDVLCNQFCVCLPLVSNDCSGWQRIDLFALGLQGVENYRYGEQHYGLFKYHLKDYKKTPDWLNSDNWANPTMWGKYWW